MWCKHFLKVSQRSLRNILSDYHMNHRSFQESKEAGASRSHAMKSPRILITGAYVLTNL